MNKPDNPTNAHDGGPPTRLVAKPPAPRPDSAPTVGVEVFLKVLVKSKLLNDRQQAEVTAQVKNSAGAQALAEVVVKKNWITRWQAERLLAGECDFYLGKYCLLEKLGEGGMGAVFKAMQGVTKRKVALKVLSPQFASRPEAVARFQREVQVAAALSHPNIVTTFDADCAGDRHFLVMEYVAGRDLSQWIAGHGPLPCEWACECIRQAAVGLQHAHEQGLIHRDLKPANLMVVGQCLHEAPLVKILDMGLARFEVDNEGPELTRSGEVFGTPQFIAPEQAMNTKEADIRSDIFSLGCTLFKALTGQNAYLGGTVTEQLSARFAGPARRLEEVIPTLPRSLSQIVEKSLRKRPAERYQTPLEFAQALATFLAEQQPTDLERIHVITSDSTWRPAAPVLVDDSLPARVMDTIPPNTPPPNTALPNTFPPNTVPLASGAEPSLAHPAPTSHSRMPRLYRQRRWITAAVGLAAAMLLAVIWHSMKTPGVAKGESAGKITKVQIDTPKVADTAKVADSPKVVNRPKAPETHHGNGTEDAPNLAAFLASPDYQWSAPQNLGPEINAGSRNLNATLTSDELFIIFSSDGRFWSSRRARLAEPFGKRESLPDSINDRVRDPSSLSGDGLLFVFSSSRASNTSDDIWISVRRNRDEPFGDPLRLPEPVNTAGSESVPLISSDGLTLFLTRAVGGPAGSPITMFTRPGRDQPFGNRIPLPTSVNGPGFNTADWYSADGRVLVSTVMGAQPPYTPLFHTRPARDVPFGPGQAFGPVFGPGANPGRPWLSADGQRMYFHSRDFPGKLGDLDLWMSRRVPKR